MASLSPLNEYYWPKKTMQEKMAKVDVLCAAFTNDYCGKSTICEHKG